MRLSALTIMRQSTFPKYVDISLLWVSLGQLIKCKDRYQLHLKVCTKSRQSQGMSNGPWKQLHLRLLLTGKAGLAISA